MAYGDLPYDAPLKANKGLEGGACNRQSCQAEPADYYNHGSHRWYCVQCAMDIGNDVVNHRSWMLNYYIACGHPQFETRAQMREREHKEQTGTAAKRAIAEHYMEKRPSLRDLEQNVVMTKAQSSSLQRLLKKAKK